MCLQIELIPKIPGNLFHNEQVYNLGLFQIMNCNKLSYKDIAQVFLLQCHTIYYYIKLNSQLAQGIRKGFQVLINHHYHILVFPGPETYLNWEWILPNALLK